MFDVSDLHVFKKKKYKNLDRATYFPDVLEHKHCSSTVWHRLPPMEHRYLATNI